MVRYGTDCHHELRESWGVSASLISWTGNRCRVAGRNASSGRKLDRMDQNVRDGGQASDNWRQPLLAQEKGKSLSNEFKVALIRAEC